MRISARNRLCGTVTSITPGAVNSQVEIELKDTPTVTAIITKEAVEELGLTEGGDACAVVKASDVLVGVCQEGKCGCKEHE
jgi:molybdate transport system regulatory protein